jgi:DNA gyrase subunit A
MSVIRADQVAAEAALESAETDSEAGEQAAEVKPQFVFTMTDGGFAKRSRISDYRQQSRGGLGIKTMSLTNEDRGGLVGAFIVVEGDEILSITQAGQVVRSPINAEFRPTGRSTMGVKFVTPKGGDAVAVVARSVESPEEVLEEASAGTTVSEEQSDESPDVSPDATIESGTTSPEGASGSDEGPASD